LRENLCEKIWDSTNCIIQGVETIWFSVNFFLSDFAKFSIARFPLPVFVMNFFRETLKNVQYLKAWNLSKIWKIKIGILWSLNEFWLDFKFLFPKYPILSLTLHSGEERRISEDVDNHKEQN
jgi:hypothetical protein